MKQTLLFTIESKIKQLEEEREKLTYHSDHHNCEECGLCATCNLVNQTDAKLNLLRRILPVIEQAIRELRGGIKLGYKQVITEEVIELINITLGETHK